jgi:hypothetical protein
MIKAICDTCESETENREAIEMAIRYPVCPCCCRIGTIYLKKENLTNEECEFLLKMYNIVGRKY